jgi:putative transposase
MIYNPRKHHRRSIRLKGYDYCQEGAYFVTICTNSREILFGNIINNTMILNELGTAVGFTWNDLPNHNPQIYLDEFVIMPNHIHGIIFINRDEPDPVVFVGAGSEPAPTAHTTIKTNHKNHGLPEIMRQFKTFSARRINEIRHTPGIPVWQRNYYEHIIRNWDDFYHIKKYIIDNPAKWNSDKQNPDNT